MYQDFSITAAMNNRFTVQHRPHNKKLWSGTRLVDLFAADRALPELKSGDLVAILSAGAYGAVMAGDYNARPRPPEVLVAGEQWGIVRPRESHADLIAKDRIPDWLAD